MKCSQCGTEFGVDEKFCGCCGESLVTTLNVAKQRAQKKMISGIIFTAIGYFLAFLMSPIPPMIGFGFGGVDVAPIISGMIVLMSIPFFAVGIPFLITGIIGMTRMNRQINQITKAAPASASVETSVCNTTPIEESVATPDVAPVEEPVVTPVMESQTVEDETQKETVEFDWRKYEPLDAGVSYDAGRDRKSVV